MFDFLRRTPPERSASARAGAPTTKSASAPLIALSLTARTSWGARDYAGLAREGVTKNAVD